MAEDKIGQRLGGHEFPVTDDAHKRRYQMAEGVAMYDLRPPSADDAAMSMQIDEIHDQLARDIPKLQREMDELLTRVRRPGLA